MTLVEKQGQFTKLMCHFELALFEKGYTVTDGEAYRTPEMAALYQKEGRGIIHSLHCLRLARDINLFKGSIQMVSVLDFLVAGELWENYSTQEMNCSWGGRFLKPDANHFSLAHQGVK